MYSRPAPLLELAQLSTHLLALYAIAPIAREMIAAHLYPHAPDAFHRPSPLSAFLAIACNRVLTLRKRSIRSFPITC
jgi:hypothetical protein